MAIARLSVPLVGLSFLLVGAVYAQAPLTVQNGVLTEQNGMTVYTYDKDTANSGKSVCNDACAASWPPLTATTDAKAEGDYSVITRNDGTRQWAYKGMPLYTFARDTKPGDKTGDKVRQIWHVVEP